MYKPKAAIIYGNGGDLGNFEVFAQGIRRQIATGYSPRDIIVRNIIYKEDFFRFVETFTTDHAAVMSELHILSHAIGGGVYLGYAVPDIGARREALRRAAAGNNRRVTYDEVVATEVGAILTDDFLTATMRGKSAKYRMAFAPDATIKLWGCNSGVHNWVYSDNGLTDPTIYSQEHAFYWRALNTKNTPKPAVAQAFADFFQRKTFGARSGAHVEVLHRGKWVSSAKYKSEVNSWPSPRLVHRLHPDRGEYFTYKPSPMP